MPPIPFALRAAAAAAALAAGTTAGVAAASTASAQAATHSKREHAVKHERRELRERRAEINWHARLDADNWREQRHESHAVSHHRRRHPEPTRPVKQTPPPTVTPTTTQTTPTTTTPTTTKTTTTPTSTTPTTTTPTTTTPTGGNPGGGNPGGGNPGGGNPGGSVQPVGVAGNWNLVFDDEFNGSSLNTSTWNASGWTNNNMNGGSVASNVSESGGNLALQVGSGGATGAQVETRNAPFAVGDYAEASVYFAGSGSRIDNWPAWWVSGPNWPAAGESDIAEGLGTLTVNYHSPSGAHNQGTIPGTWAGGYHTYGIYRGSNYCDVYWDGQLVKHYSTDDNGQPENLIFTNGLGNNIVPGAAGAMKVDYVRVWS